MTKQEILDKKNWSTMCPNYMAEKEILEAMDEYAQPLAIGFAEWLHPDSDGNHWQMYDGRNRWVNLKNSEVKTTKQLFDLYILSKNEKGN